MLQHTHSNQPWPFAQQQQEQDSLYGVPSTAAVGKIPQRFSFPEKVFYLLNNCTDYVSWTRDGKAFVVRDIAAFEQDILKPIFRHSKFTSFARQLSSYGFTRKRLSGLDVEDTLMGKALPMSPDCDMLDSFWRHVTHRDQGQKNSAESEAYFIHHPNFQRERPDLVPFISKKVKPHGPLHINTKVQEEQEQGEHGRSGDEELKSVVAMQALRIEEQQRQLQEMHRVHQHTLAQLTELQKLVVGSLLPTIRDLKALQAQREHIVFGMLDEVLSPDQTMPAASRQIQVQEQTPSTPSHTTSTCNIWQ